MNASRMWAAVLAVAAVAVAQTAVPSAREIGAVTAVDAAAKTFTIRTDAGASALIRYDERTSFRKVAPGAKDLAGAAAITAAELSEGDRVVARGTVEAANGLSARSVVVMAKEDVASKQAADRAEWDRRGMGGIVTAVNPQAREVTVKVPAPGETRTVTVALSEAAQLRRYAPESVKFSDAKASRIEEIQPGDQIKALGTKSADGTRFTADELVSGAFANIAATVDSIDISSNSVVVTNLATKKKISVRLTVDSAVRRLPVFAANMLANAGERRNRTAGPAGPAPVPQGRREGVAYPLSPSGAGGPGGAMRERPRDLQSVLERIPAISIAELKPGDAVIIASTRGADPSSITAINILAGVEPLLTASPQGNRAPSMGSWNLDLNMNMSLP